MNNDDTFPVYEGLTEGPTIKLEIYRYIAIKLNPINTNYHSSLNNYLHILLYCIESYFSSPC